MIGSTNYLNALSIAYRDFGKAVMDGFAESSRIFGRAFRRYKSSSKRWTMMAPNGQNSKTRKRNQVKLKGRGCREHKGGYPTRGKGRTSRSKR